MLTSAIRYIVPKGPRVKGGSIQLLCHVKPGAHAKREGVAAVTDEQIELCVAAQAREGEANKAVREVIAETLNCPKSDVEITKGMKSREKTVVINNITMSGTAEQIVERIKIILLEGVTR